MAHLGHFLILISCLATYTQGKHKTLQNRYAGRIVNGDRGEQSLYPFLANVQKKTSRDGDPYGAWQRWGSGAIVSQYHVLTACHVIADLDVETDSFNQKPDTPGYERRRSRQSGGKVKALSWRLFRVYVGSGNNLLEQSPTSQYRYARRLTPHPDCGADTIQFVKNDVGVIKVQRPFDYNTHVQPISVISLDLDVALDAARQLQAQQTWCQAVGWGETENEEYMPHNLFWVANVQLIANDDCWVKFDTDHYACTLSNTQSMCSGDSGGPLICQGHLFGIHSSSSCTPGYINYMANVEPIVYMMNIHVTLDPPGGKRGAPGEEESKDHVFVEPEGHNIHGAGVRKLERKR